MASQGDMDEWYANPVYARYWQHYKHAINWHKRHKRAYKKAMEACYIPSMFHMYSSSVQQYSDWDAAEGRLDRDRATEEESETDENDESSDEGMIECTVSNVDISEELRQYFAQTEMHRQNLKIQQEMNAVEQDSYVLADEDLHRVSWKSVLPPSERPGESRAVEMKKLYGKEAAKIQGMETAMLLTFDRNCDRKQPKYWPVIPLNL
ncbi:Gem-associated protein 8 [Triplophysa tibetana]|uniref:Gem-associated protein 8 n=1 Tax=Triplophysa tibetana TaxID=1572043 RepID=A0A5A9N3N8_9TELE|nr:Gem-associated protein 8 [Triplophysa tibetana]